jgi:hypothetical protein
MRAGSMMSAVRAAALLLLVSTAAPACEPIAPPRSTTDAGASPNASILPAPLATEAPELPDTSVPVVVVDAGATGMTADSAGRLIMPDAGAPPPEPLRPEAPVPAESPSSREVGGVSLAAVFRWRDVPAPLKAPEVSADGIREATKLTTLSWKIDLSETGRMKIDFTSRALPLPKHTEIRARADRYGNLVLWPYGTEYRVIPPGALRAVLGERRVDVTPLAAGTAKSQGEGKRLGFVTRKVEVSSPLATLKLELGKVTEAGEGGALLCRALLDIGGFDPKAPTCQASEVPLSAAYTWQQGGGGIVFEVTALTKHADLAANSLLTPPPGAAFAASGLPAVPHGIFLSRDEIAAFRTAPLQLPPNTDATAPGEGFVAVNHADILTYLLVDGVPVVAVPAVSERYVIGLPRGRYVIQWRTFLGEKVEPPATVEIPARLIHGGNPDAGAPDGG